MKVDIMAILYILQMLMFLVASFKGKKKKTLTSLERVLFSDLFTWVVTLWGIGRMEKDVSEGEKCFVVGPWGYFLL